MITELGKWPWFALHTRSRHEKISAISLQQKGYEDFLPLYRSLRRWSDRRKEVELPLFPGYVFCRLDPLNRMPILSTPGVLSIVGAGKNPVAVEEAEISALQAMVRSGLDAQPWPFLQAGQRVQIEAGPLEGVEGILLSVKNSSRLILSVSLLQRSVAVEIDRCSVRPLSRRPPSSAERLSPAAARIYA